MELRAGYKQTEVGIIPTDWNVKTLGDVATFRTGPFGSSLHKSDYIFDGVPVINPMHIVDGKIKPSQSMTVPEEIANKLSDFKLSAQEIIIGRRGDMGRCAVVRPDNVGWLCGTGSMIVRPERSVNFSFLQRILESPEIISTITDAAVGSTMINLNQGTLSGLKIKFPPFTEQTAIANTLSDADALIDSLQKLIAKKRQIKQGAMQELLQPKEDWSETTIFQIADSRKDLFDDGDWIESEHITNKGIRLIQTGNIGVGSFIEKEDKKYIYEESFEKLGCKLLRAGDLLICRLAEPAGRACIFPGLNDEKVITSVDVTIYRPRSEVVCRDFLNQIFATKGWFKLVGDLCGGTTHKRIARGSLGRIKISIPGITEQNRIAGILTSMDAEIAALETKLAKYQQIKQGMMQNLLTGRIRLV